MTFPHQSFLCLHMVSGRRGTCSLSGRVREGEREGVGEERRGVRVGPGWHQRGRNMFFLPKREEGTSVQVGPQTPGLVHLVHQYSSPGRGPQAG